MATLRGEPVDRPAVCFYEINGLDERTDDPDSYNIYSHPSWEPVIALARERTDRIVMRPVPFINRNPDPLADQTEIQLWENGTSRYERTTIRCAGGHVLTSLTRRDRDVNTLWQVEHLLKNVDDLRHYLDLPCAPPSGEPDTGVVASAEAALGDSGIVIIDTSDPLCQAAALFHMQDYTVIATTERELFHRLLDRFNEQIYYQTEAVARALPGRLWRIYGPEYASPPYLHPRLFPEYVTAYVKPMVDLIQRKGGFARVHCHGRIRLILDEIISSGCSGLDPIEPPPQGDMQLREVRERCGDQVVLFGNLEASDLENLPLEEFEGMIRRAIEEGVGGRGFVLMPSACPYGRVLSERTRRNYERMVEVVSTR
jgi:hypothetical protein